MARVNGKCTSCGKRIGGYTANGFFRWDKKLMSQIALIFVHAENLNDPSARTTKVHIPVCKSCSENVDFENLDAKLCENQKDYRKFRENSPMMSYKSFEIDKLPWDN